MTTIVHPSGNGGVPGRRAMVRWAWRLYRREWRQQALVLGILIVGVAASIGVALAAYNITPVSGNATLGDATSSFQFADPAPADVADNVQAAADFFGTVDVIGHREVPVAGSPEPLDYRSQDPNGAYSHPMLGLRRGSYPVSGDQIAVTDGVADQFGLTIGDTFALDGTERQVVGIVENPSDLHDEFALLPLDIASHFDSMFLLVDAEGQQIGDFRMPSGGPKMVMSRSTDENVLAVVGVFTAAAIAMFLVALVTASSFIVVAQRRQRQLGMLAAIGATPRHLRLVMVSGGAAMGAVAAVIGSCLGVVGWIAAVPRIERAAGYRLDAYNIPWWLVAIGMVLSLLTAIGSAWWPARQAARVPIVTALSGRPPRPLASTRSAALAIGVLAAGIGCLLAAGDPSDRTSSNVPDLLLIAGGTISTIVGVLLISPLAVRALAACASRMPVAFRLPLRDLGRFQARSGAALAAISLALGVPVAVVVTASAAANTADSGNLSDRQLLIRQADADGPFVPNADDVDALQRGADAIEQSLDDAIMIPIEAVIGQQAPPAQKGIDAREALSVVRPFPDGWEFVSLLYVATPPLLDRYGIDVDALPSTTTYLTTESNDVSVLGPPDATPPTRDQATPDQANRRRDDLDTLASAVHLDKSYTSVPHSFVTESAMAERGWHAISAGQWLVDLARPLTADQLSAVREIAAGAGLTIETRDDQAGLSTLRTAATAVGIALALGILAMTVGLIRVEAEGDLRTLAATGASRSTRRTLTATTAGGLAVLGAVLGIAGAYAALAAGPFGDLDRLKHVPVAQLGMIAFGTPIIAAGVGWLVSGREPASMARQPVA